MPGKRKLRGWKSSPARRASSSSAVGCPTTPWRRFESTYVGIKGPLTTPVGGGIRSLNVALRQLLDLYVCLRPVRWYAGVPSPVKHPEKVDMVIFRENTEDIYAGIEFVAGSAEAQKLLEFLAKDFPKEYRKIRFGSESAVRTWQAQLEAIGAPNRELGVEVGLGLEGDQSPRHRAACAQRDRVRHQERAQERHAGAQGQHHEVHRRRLPRLGLPGRQGVLRRSRRSTGDPGARFRRGNRAPASSSRTRLPTSPSNRC